MARRYREDGAVLYLGDGVEVYTMKEALRAWIGSQREETNGRRMAEDWLLALTELQPDDEVVSR